VIRRSWWVLLGSFGLLGLLALAQVVAGADAIDWLVVALLVVAGVAVAFHHRAVLALEAARRREAESFARILQGLSRSVSPDAIVAAIVEELGEATGADHLVVVRRPPGTRLLEATMVSRRPGVPSSTTLVPFSDLEARGEPAVAAHGPVAVTVGSPAGVAGMAMAARTPSPAAPTVIAIPVGNRAGASPPDRSAAAAPGSPAALVEHDQAVADRLAARVRSIYGLQHVITEPLRTPEGIVGAIVLSRRTPDAWPPAAGRLLEGAAFEASAALTRAHSHRAAETLASTDGLTGLPNRRYFDEFCGLLARRRRSEDGIGVLMIDIDRFKRLNDDHGHAAGDEVLRSVAGAIGGAIREHDVPARYGGEEFAVLLRNPSRTVAIEVGERVRMAVRTIDLSSLGSAAVTVSVGTAVATSPDQPIADLIEQADRALFQAKRGGRDRVMAA
jgi:diguanylate cyclase (GGDEF)-like protein